MADNADNANDLNQLELDSIFKNRIPEKSSYYKLCRNCKEPTPDGYPFCDEDCRDDFEKYGSN